MKAGRAWSRLAALLWMLSFLPLAATAATQPGASDKGAVELPQPLTRDAIRELVARLSDEEVRKLLLAQLDKAAAPDAASPHPTSMAAGLAGDVDRTRSELGAMGHPGADMVTAMATIAAQELGWDGDRREREITAIDAFYRV